MGLFEELLGKNKRPVSFTSRGGFGSSGSSRPVPGYGRDVASGGFSQSYDSDPFGGAEAMKRRRLGEVDNDLFKQRMEAYYSTQNKDKTEPSANSATAPARNTGQWLPDTNPGLENYSAETNGYRRGGLVRKKPALNATSGGRVLPRDKYEASGPDRIQAKLDAGEFVIPAKSAQQLAALVGDIGMEMLRRGKLPGSTGDAQRNGTPNVPRYKTDFRGRPMMADGGYVPDSTGSSSGFFGHDNMAGLPDEQQKAYIEARGLVRGLSDGAGYTSPPKNNAEYDDFMYKSRRPNLLMANLFPPTASAPANDGGVTDFLGDMGKHVMSGVNTGLVRPMGTTMRILGAENAGKTLEEIGQTGSEYWIKGKHDGFKLSPVQEEAENTSIFKDGGVNPSMTFGKLGRKIAGATAESLPEILATAIPSAGAASLASKAGAGAKMAAAIGSGVNTLAGGVLSGAQNAYKSGREVRAANLGALANSPDYRRYRSMGLSPDNAREQTAQNVENQVFLETIPANIALGKFSDFMVPRTIKRFGTNGLLAKTEPFSTPVLKDISKKAFQSPTEQYIQNNAAIEHFDPSRNPYASVAERTVSAVLPSVGKGRAKVAGAQMMSMSSRWR